MSRATEILARGAIAAALLATGAAAHVGSPDVYFEGDAGPYHLMVAIRTPQVIPGVAEVEVRSDTSDLRSVRIVPLPLVGSDPGLAPEPDPAERSSADPTFFSGSLWLMESGSWQVRIELDGARGPGAVAVPVAAAPRRTLALQGALAAGLLAAMLILSGGLVLIAGGAAREGELEPGGEAGAGHAAPWESPRRWSCCSWCWGAFGGTRRRASTPAACCTGRRRSPPRSKEKSSCCERSARSGTTAGRCGPSCPTTAT